MTTITALNGLLPATELVVVDTGVNGPQRLHVSVAPIWLAMLEAGMPAGCLTSGYRTRDEQAIEVQRAKDGLTPTAAPVGQSVHGEGKAADIAYPALTWARAHAAAWGLRFPIASELWHCDLGSARIYPTPTTPPPTPPVPEEDDMKPWLVHDTSGSMVALQFPDGTWAQVETNAAMQDLSAEFGRPREVDPITFARFCPPARKRA